MDHDLAANGSPVRDAAPRRVEANRDASVPTPHYATLDALRGVAAFAVMLLHGQDFFHPGLADSAYLAVDLFFLLSGFVVAHAYGDRLAAGMPVRRFFELRLVRLYPLHLAGLVLGLASVLVMLAIGDDRLTLAEIGFGLLAGALFLPAPFTGTALTLFPLNAPAWSLFFEVVVNGAYGRCCRWLSRPALVVVVAASAAALLVQATAAGTIDSGATWSNIHGGFARVFFSFTLGVLIWTLRARIPAALGRFGAWPLLVILLALLLIDGGSAVRRTYDLAFVLVVSPLLVAAGTQARATGRTRRGFAFLGAISFPLYVLHFPLIAPMLALAEAAGIALPVMGIAYLVLSVAVAMVAMPIDARIRRRILGRRAASVPATPASAP